MALEDVSGWMDGGNIGCSRWRQAASFWKLQFACKFRKRRLLLATKCDRKQAVFGKTTVVVVSHFWRRPSTCRRNVLEFVPKVAIGLEPWYSIKQGTRDGGSHGLDRGQSGEV